MNPAISIECGEQAPPIYFCVDCVDMLPRHRHHMVDVLKPLQSVPVKCENKVRSAHQERLVIPQPANDDDVVFPQNCSSAKNVAICTCFSLQCVALNGFRPVRYCQACHRRKHDSSDGLKHVFHVTVPDLWSCDPDTQSYLIEAIVR